MRADPGLLASPTRAAGWASGRAACPAIPFPRFANRHTLAVAVTNIARVMYSTRVFTLAAKPAIDLRGRKIDADSGPDRLHFSYMAWEGFSMRIHNQFAFADGMRLLRQAQRTNGVGYVIIGS